MTAIFASDLFKQIQGWQDYYDDFHDYVHFDDTPPYFGRDEKYKDELWHMHLAADDQVRDRWALKRRQFDRTTEKGDSEEIRAKDIWLLYAHDEYTDNYLLLTILGPDAHNGPKWSGYLGKLKKEIIDPWIYGRVKYEPEP